MTKHSYYGSGIDDPERREKDDQLLLDDSSYTFRVNAQLKADFLKLCKREQYTASSALKRYMLRCVQKGYISHDMSVLKPDKYL
jgi:hypothetical protein